MPCVSFQSIRLSYRRPRASRGAFDIAPAVLHALLIIEQIALFSVVVAHRTRGDERKKVALEIHDHAGQMITALKFDISSAGHNAGAFPESKAKRTVLAKLESAQKFLGDVHVALVKIATSLRSAALNSGLLLALKTEAAAFAEGAGWGLPAGFAGHGLALSDHAATLFPHLLGVLDQHCAPRRCDRGAGKIDGGCRQAGAPD